MENNKTAPCAGHIIIEQCNDHGITRADLGKRLSLTPYGLDRLLNGESRITFKIAGELEALLGLPVSFWIKLDGYYVDEREKERTAKQAGTVGGEIVRKMIEAYEKRR